MIERTILSAPPSPRSSGSAPQRAAGGRPGLSSQGVRFALIVAGVAFLTFVLFLYVLPNSEMSAARVRIAELRAQKAALNRANAEVLMQIAHYSDMKTLELRARQLGMGPARQAIYLRLPGVDLQAPRPEVRSGSPAGNSAPIVGAPTGPTGLRLIDQLKALNVQQRLKAVRSMLVEAVDRTLGRLAPQVKSTW